MEQSILKSTKKILGLGAEYTPFDQDVLTHINAAFGTLHQLDIGPSAGVFIEDEEPEWDSLGLPVIQLNLVRAYVFLKVRLLFDPPGTSFLIQLAQDQVKEYEWRLLAMRDEELLEEV